MKQTKIEDFCCVKIENFDSVRGMQKTSFFAVEELSSSNIENFYKNFRMFEKTGGFFSTLILFI
jgi:hypothetical protein